MRRIVYNTCFGGFCLSDRAIQWLRDHRYMSNASNFQIESSFFNIRMRNSDALLNCIDTLGLKAVSGTFANLAIYEYDEEEYTYDISEYDGRESVKLIPLVRKDKLEELFRKKDLRGLINYLEEKEVNLSI